MPCPYKLGPRLQNPVEDGLLRGYRNAVEALTQAVVLIANLVGKAAAEFLEETVGISVFLGPIGGIDAQKIVHGGAGDIQAIESERIGCGHKADRRFRGCRLAFNTLDDPLQDANIFAVSWPEEFSVGALAEPVYVEDFRRAGNTLSHLEPMAEIIGHVIAAEGQHGHGIAARNAHRSGRG